MKTFVGLLRAVNLAGHNAVSMADLRVFLAAIGLENPRTLLASGNFVAGAAARGGAQLERQLERESAKRLKLETEFFVRTPAEWSDLVEGNTFRREAARDPARLVVVFLKSEPAPARVTALEGAIRGPETVRALGRHLFAYYPEGQGRSKLTAALIERHLGGPGTARNWNTVLKLHAMLES